MSTSPAPSLVVLAAGLARRYGGCKPLAPIGPRGESVIDLLAGDACRAGFGSVVLVLHPETGPAIRYHVERCWPKSLAVDFVEQRLPLGTTHAVLSAQPALKPDQPFAVANADDVYGEDAMRTLQKTLAQPGVQHLIVAYELANTIVTGDPVTRGICEVDPAGNLVSVTERRKVSRIEGPTGPSFRVDDGRQPDTLAPNTSVSVNLWGFRPSIWAHFREAMDASGLDEEAILADVAQGATPPKAELLLPDVIGTLLAAGRGAPAVEAAATDARCIGVTHAADLPVVRAELSRLVAWGSRPDHAWAGCA